MVLRAGATRSTSLRRHYPVQVQTVGGLGRPPSQPGRRAPVPANPSAALLPDWSVDDRRERLRTARLYLVCDDAPDEFLERALCAAASTSCSCGSRTASDARDPRGRAPVRARLPPTHGALFILNDRPDLVGGRGADGVHVGQDDLAVARRARSSATSGSSASRPTRRSRSTPPRGAASTTSASGPVHATPTKPGRPRRRARARPLRGARRARSRSSRSAASRRPTSAAVRDAGATRIAVVRALTEAADPERAASSAPDGDDSRAEVRSWLSVAASAASASKPAGSRCGADRDGRQRPAAELRPVAGALRRRGAAPRSATPRSGHS